MVFKNANIFTEDFQFVRGGFTVENGRFGKVFEGDCDCKGYDLGGAYVIPGLIDVHNHGNSNADFSDGDYEGVARMAAYLGANGVTSFAPASMTLPYDVLEKAFATAAKLHAEKPAGSSKLQGIQMEGPFFSEKKKGAQNGAYLRLPDYEAFEKLYHGCGGLVKIVDVAPELEGAEEFVAKASKLCTVSIAHTDSDYEHAKAAIDAGVTHLTHLYNAMPPIHHRKPGVIGACAENKKVRAELICDGIHVHPSSIRMAFSLFGASRIVLISDALRCCGMPDGTYELGGQAVYLKGKTCTLADGTLAGSVTNLFDCMRNVISYGIAPEKAVRAATWNPACALGLENEIGSIAPGKCADFVICDADLNRKAVYIDGELV
ncbi:MAG: N-acetylglucosamine-6-phosphate deacetylase [Ruminococcaceae bacterium]|jgi:N-acetylglucosamine-6-phosphate deacetylase|nr:N-acetylglucosamine-6-phosphate deacetylase [Oscillospiraceae bacterium]